MTIRNASLWLLLLLTQLLSAQTYTPEKIDQLNQQARNLVTSGVHDYIMQGISIASDAASNAEVLNYSKGKLESYEILVSGYEKTGNTAMMKRYQDRIARMQGRPIESSPRIKPTPAVTEQKPSAPSAEDRRKDEELYKQQYLLEVQRKSMQQMDDQLRKKQEELARNSRLIDSLDKATRTVLSELDEREETMTKQEAELMKQRAENALIAEQIKSLTQEKQLKELQVKQQALTTRILIGGLVGLLLFLIVLAFFIHRQRKTNRELESAYSHLKATQTRLVQSEKLASLGQLTAGIAHEIQNPLNFVNNFSEIAIDLMEELKNTSDDDERNELITTLQTNLGKIKHHGTRADSIVKGMLSHSRDNKGERETVDINSLLTEYSGLAFHGMRATDKSFQCDIELQLDTAAPKIIAVKQDISRVVLNLMNNALYSANKKRQSVPDGNYKPIVRITSSLQNGSVAIGIRDNGIGMKEEMRAKIFEPFYTTKPTGEGTGLGLSISHDIIVAHGGEISVKSREGEGAEFVITLPH